MESSPWDRKRQGIAHVGRAWHWRDCNGCGGPIKAHEIEYEIEQPAAQQHGVAAFSFRMLQNVDGTAESADYRRIRPRL